MACIIIVYFIVLVCLEEGRKVTQKLIAEPSTATLCAKFSNVILIIIFEHFPTTLLLRTSKKKKEEKSTRDKSDNNMGE